jgi:hypothetical protein
VLAGALAACRNGSGFVALEVLKPRLPATLLKWPFEGQIDDLLSLGRALSAKEIEMIATKGPECLAIKVAAGDVPGYEV